MTFFRQSQQHSNDIFLLKESFHRLSKRLVFLETFLKSKFLNEFESHELPDSKSISKPTRTNPNSKGVSFYSRRSRINRKYLQNFKKASNSIEQPPEASQEEEEVLLRDASGQPIHWENPDTLEFEGEKQRTESRTLQEEPYSDADYYPNTEGNSDVDSYSISPESQIPITIPEDEDAVAVKWLLNDQNDNNIGGNKSLKTKNEKKSIIGKEGQDQEIQGDEEKDPSILKCSICQKEFPGSGSKARAALKSHQEIHSFERNYKCQYCDKAFRQSGALRCHMKGVHKKGNFKMHACQYCPKTFLLLKDKTHHEMIHTGEKPVVCEICGYKCIRKYALQRHMLSKHEESQNCLCQECGKNFKNQPSLRKHMLVVHSQSRRNCSDGKSVPCSICSLTFVNESYMKGHKRRVHGIREPRRRRTENKLVKKTQVKSKQIKEKEIGASRAPRTGNKRIKTQSKSKQVIEEEIIVEELVFDHDKLFLE